MIKIREMTPEETREFIERTERGLEKEREKKRFWGKIIFTPLTIVMSVVIMIARFIGALSSLLILIAIAQFIDGIKQVMAGAAIWDVKSFTVAIGLFVFPFIVYGFVALAEEIHKYFLIRS